jgi:hypothetical protein
MMLFIQVVHKAGSSSQAPVSDAHRGEAELQARDGCNLWRPRFLINPNKSVKAGKSGQITVNLGPHLEKLTNLL